MAGPLAQLRSDHLGRYTVVNYHQIATKKLRRFTENSWRIGSSTHVLPPFSPTKRLIHELEIHHSSKGNLSLALTAYQREIRTDNEPSGISLSLHSLIFPPPAVFTISRPIATRLAHLHRSLLLCFLGSYFRGT